MLEDQRGEEPVLEMPDIGRIKKKNNDEEDLVLVKRNRSTITFSYFSSLFLMILIQTVIVMSFYISEKVFYQKYKGFINLKKSNLHMTENEFGNEFLAALIKISINYISRYL